jgi:uncharacterized protein (TIGR03084 family)
MPTSARVAAMAMSMSELCDDLRAEGDLLVALLAPLDEAAWDTPTPAEGWLVRDQVSHLAWNDEAARLAMTDPERFAAQRPATPEGIQAMVDAVIADHHHRTGPDLLAWYEAARTALLATAVELDPGVRIPWYGPPMSVASKITARFMETWAHGLDVADALGVDRAPTDRIRHVVFLGLRALPNSFVANGLPVPDRAVRLEVTAPSGQTWRMGPDDAPDVVRGSALDLALVVTQRRNLADTDLVASGPAASAWLPIAQAFAGPPGPGRPPAGAAG